tara:strand:- start:1517 stop:2605 length:1089 start_codon:yes stop_codon:yes gene_type:complete
MAMKTHLGLALVLVVSVAPAMAQDKAGKIDLLGSITLPTGLLVGGEEFGGISGLDYDAASDRYFAISDDRSQRAPARFYELKLGIDAEGVHSVDIAQSHMLRQASGDVFPEGGVDPEAIRFDADRKSIIWSSEGDVQGAPAIYESRLDGTFLRSFAVPAYYTPNADNTAGVYSNLAFEGIAISADGATLFAMTENALAQDGAKAVLEAGSHSRLIAFDIKTGAPRAEYIYETGPIFTKATAEPPYNDNGVSDIMVLEDGRLITVERSFAAGVGNQIKLFVTSIDGASDIAGQGSIEGVKLTPVGKVALGVIGEGDFGLDIDNIESITFGPEVDGGQTIIVASDNNFSAAQFTQFVAFKLTLN